MRMACQTLCQHLNEQLNKSVIHNIHSNNVNVWHRHPRLIEADRRVSRPCLRLGHSGSRSASDGLFLAGRATNLIIIIIVFVVVVRFVVCCVQRPT